MNFTKFAALANVYLKCEGISNTCYFLSNHANFAHSSLNRQQFHVCGVSCMKPRIYQLFVVCRNEIVNLSLSCEGAFYRGNCLRKFSQREGDYFFNGCGRGEGLIQALRILLGESLKYSVTNTELSIYRLHLAVNQDCPLARFHCLQIYVRWCLIHALLSHLLKKHASISWHCRTDHKTLFWKHPSPSSTQQK